MSQQAWFNKFKYALRGLVYLYWRERSFRWQVLAALAVQLLAWYLSLPAVVWALLTLTSVVVLSAEAFNTALERLFDLVEPRLSEQVSLLKNILAAAVAIVAIGAVGVAWLLLVG